MSGALRNPHLMGNPPNSYMVHQFAVGLYNEWLSETPQNRRHMVRNVYLMAGGPERVGAMRFISMVNDAHVRGEV